MATIRDARSVAEVIAALPNMFLTLKLTDSAAAEWAGMLVDIPVPLLAQAAIDVAALEDFVSPAKLRKRAAELLRGDAGEKSGAIAWREALEAVARYGAYRTPVFDDPRVEHCVRVIGWHVLCMQGPDDTVSNRARFISEWESARDRITLAQVLPPAPREQLSEMAKHWLLPSAGRPTVSLRDAVRAIGPRPGSAPALKPGSESA